MRRIIINNKFFPRIQDKLILYKGHQCDVMDEAEFLEAFPSMNDTIILGYGYEFYQALREMHASGAIHIGLRKFDYNSFSQIPIIFIGTNRLVFGRYPVINKDSEDSLVYVEQPDGSWYSDWTDPKLDFFFSDGVLADPLPLPEVKIVGLREGIQYLKMFMEAPYDTAQIGLDFESNGRTPEDSHFTILGFALSTVEPLTSVYFDYRLDYGFNPYNWTQQNADDMTAFNELFKEFLDKSWDRIWTYNCKFEIKVCFWMYQKFYELQDAYALAICDEVKRSLKYCVQYYLHSPSWDDLLDEQMATITDVFNYNKSFDELKLKIDSGAELTESEQFIKDNPDIYERMRYYWGDCWSIADPTTMGIYCGYDSTYTVYLRNHLWKQYQYPYEIYHRNQLLGADLGLSGIDVNIKARRALTEWYNNTLKNIYAWFNYLYYTEYIKLYGGLIDEFNIPPVLIKLIMANTALLTGDRLTFGKELMRLVVDQDLADKENRFDITKLNDLLGVDVTDELSWVNDDGYLGDGYNRFFRQRKLFVMIAESVFTAIQFDVTKFFAEINKKAIEPVVDRINEFNSEVRKLVPIDYPIPEIINTLNLFYKKPDLDYETAKSWQPEELKDKYTEQIHGFIKMIPEEVQGKIRQYIDLDNEDIYYTWFEYNLPEQIFKDGIDLVTPDKIANAIYYKTKLEHMPDFDNLVPTTSKFISDEDGEPILNYNSAAEFNGWWNIVKHRLGKTIVYCEEFVNALLGGQIEVDRSSPEAVNEAFEKFVATGEAAGAFTKLKSYKYYMVDPVSVPQMRNCSAWYYPGFFMTPLKEEECNLSLNLSGIETLRRLIYMCDLSAVCRKELSTYIVGITAGAWKPVYYGDTKYCQFDYDNSAQDIYSDEPALYTPDFQINMKETKRWSSNFHTYRQKDDIMMCLTAPEGCINTYFDISQAEPRSLCYISQDPLFMELYDSGKDAYMELAKLAWPDKSEKEIKESYRPIAKTALLAKIYGRSDASLANDLEVEPEVVAHMGNAMFGVWKRVAELRQHKLDFVAKTGLTETLLGDKVSNSKENAYTQAVNYFNQNGTAVILVDGFYNSVKKIHEAGIEIHPKSVVHDSNTNTIPIPKVFQCDLIYYRYFRQYCRDKYGIDYKYDLDISRNFRDKLKYRFDPTTRICTMSGYDIDVDYILSYLGPCDIVMTKDNLSDVKDNPMSVFYKKYIGKPHIICTDPMFTRKKIRSVEFEVRGDIPGIEDWNKPTGTPSYFDNVLRWWENTEFKTDLRRYPD